MDSEEPNEVEEQQQEEPAPAQTSTEKIENEEMTPDSILAPVEREDTQEEEFSLSHKAEEDNSIYSEMPDPGEHQYRYSGSAPSANVGLDMSIRASIAPSYRGPFMMSARQSVNQDVDLNIVDQSSEFAHKIDLIYYGDLFLEYSDRLKAARLKNNYYQYKLTQYFGKRQGAVPPIAELYNDMTGKYFQELVAYENYYKTVQTDKVKMTNENNELAQKLKELGAHLEKLFEQRQQAIIDFTNGLSNENLSKHVDRFIKRQKAQSNHIMKLRLTYIKLKNCYDEKQQAYEDLDKLGPGYHIMDYVQLKLDNKNYRDKVEERDRELSKIRDGYKHYMQVLAHTREKLEFVKQQLVESDEALSLVEEDYTSVREHLTYLRNERDDIRKQVTKIVDVLGLSCKPKLLADINNSGKEVQALQKELNIVMEEYEDTNQRLETLRAHLDLLKSHNKNE